MLNTQRLIICCLLFAAIWVQSLKAEISDEDQKILDSFVKVMNKAFQQNIKPKDATYSHLKSWGSWPQISDEVRLQIAQDFNERMELLALNARFERGPVEIAYTILDGFIQDRFTELKKAYGANFEYVEKLRKIEEDGRFLEYLAFINDKSNTKKIQKQLKELRKKMIQSSDAGLLFAANVEAYLQERPGASSDAQRLINHRIRYSSKKRGNQA